MAIMMRTCLGSVQTPDQYKTEITTGNCIPVQEGRWNNHVSRFIPSDLDKTLKFLSSCKVGADADVSVLINKGKQQSCLWMAQLAGLLKKVRFM